MRKRTQPATTDEQKFALVRRWEKVKHLLPHFILEAGFIYIIQSLNDPWGTRVPLRWCQFAEMIAEAEARSEKKPPGREGVRLDGETYILRKKTF